MKKKTNTLKKGHTKAGKEIIHALQDLQAALERREPLSKHFVVSVREVQVQEPGIYDAAAIRATREKLAVSQPIFAKLMGVSTILVQSWEQGKRFPDATARRLLDDVNREPKRWARLIYPQKAA